MNFQKVVADLLDFRYNDFLVAADYIKKHREVKLIGKQDPTSSQVISHLKLLFERQGIPELW